MPTKKGLTKYIESPERMWELFILYKKSIKANPIHIVEQKKGNIIIPNDLKGKIKLEDLATIKLPTQRPLTMEGFTNYLEDRNIISDASDYFENKDNRYKNYIHICRRIRRVIRQDQIEGGMAGIYNPSITQRLNNLTEKIESKETVVSYSVEMTKKEIKAFNDTLEDEC